MNTTKFKLHGEITYTTRHNHPDETNYKGKFADVYTFDKNLYDIEYAKSYIERDLKLIAGGGYRTDTIKDVTITIKQA